jgi:hypothetical protein
VFPVKYEPDIYIQRTLDMTRVEPSAWVCNEDTLFLVGNKYRNLALHVGGVSRIEAIKYAHEPLGTQTLR